MQILDWFVQICLSIKHIHDRKILHRDIKSQVSKEMILKVVCGPILCACDSYVDVAPICIPVAVEPFHKGLILQVQENLVYLMYVMQLLVKIAFYLFFPEYIFDKTWYREIRRFWYC